jgi:hypothetical protein
LERVHDARFVARLYDGSPGGGLEKELLSTYELIDSDGKPHRYEPDRALRPLAALFDTILAQVSASYATARLALSGAGPTPGFAFFLGGGMHHARRDAGSGFCLVNDVMIAVARLRAEGRVGSVWVIDTDAHKGDGTAELAATDEDTLTLSIHMASGWPLDAVTVEAARREGRDDSRAPLVPSDVVDGAGPHAHDGRASPAGRALSLDQCLERDRLVHRFLSDRGIPAAWLMAGGYGERAWEPTAAFLSSIAAG